ncbi:hypothetical protein GCM10010331_29850 [Streptomyces xanthochromogenes]|uniref:hypothetical protein n=1 Tax=Streptomyces xanthochromogenes TaxID=67384 RepID=UPI001675B71F|nr:hypothetical protein [Streptomyces xanthochromogenes]GHB40616.1 hypothetical protein GCM10010331_29850 [Streptomyces xanthochromogenes]
MKSRPGGAALAPLLSGLLSGLLVVLTAGPSYAAPEKPARSVALSRSEAAKGADVTVTGKGWRPGALLMLLVCGQSTPELGVIGGTNSCSNADGQAVTTDGEGSFSKVLPAAPPPKPCPCVVHVATVQGEQAVVDTELTITGHPVAPLPTESGDGRLAVLTEPRLDGSGSLLTWFGAPPARTLVFTVGNLGSGPVKDPVFQLGTAHGVFAPQWEDRQWKGTIGPGQKAEIKLDFELSPGAHGDYQVSLQYAKKLLATEPWGVDRPWGVTLFWILLCLVVPAAVFRIGMVVVDRLRPRAPRRSDQARHRGVRLPDVTVRLPKVRRAPAEGPPPAAPEPGPGTAPHGTTAALPWFTPDSAPSENHPNRP